jgi:hypothetical protein
MRQARLAELAVGLKNGLLVTFKGYAESLKKARITQNRSMLRVVGIQTALPVDSNAG